MVHATGVPYENIILSGMSQGGAMTLYYAVHGRRKLGALIPMVGWLPLAKTEPPSQLTTPPVNRDTPILHLNGLQDKIVPMICGQKTSEAMNPVFTNYNLQNIPGKHSSPYNPFAIQFKRQIKGFLQENMPQLKFKSGLFY